MSDINGEGLYRALLARFLRFIIDRTSGHYPLDFFDHRFRYVRGPSFAGPGIAILAANFACLPTRIPLDFQWRFNDRDLPRPRAKLVCTLLHTGNVEMLSTYRSSSNSRMIFIHGVNVLFFLLSAMQENARMRCLIFVVYYLTVVYFNHTPVEIST